MTVIVDTGFVYALLNETERQHRAVVDAFAHSRGPWLLPTPVTAELAYLLMKYLGPLALAAYLESIPSSDLRLVEPEENDYLRAGQLIREYRDAPLDYVDALIIASAERLKVTTILTLDRRHFHMVRPIHCLAFEILP